MKILERKQKNIAKFRLLGSIVFVSMILYVVWLLHLGNYTITTYEYTDYIDSMVASSQQQNTMQFVFVDDDNTEYKIFQKDVHGAWINRDFLFGSSEDDNENNSKETVGDPGVNWKKDIPNKNYVDDFIDDIKNDLDHVTIRPKYQDCSLPRWGSIRHEEYVLAYQQRTDEPNICNIQKRYCKNGKLSGKYTQQACEENQEIKINKHTFIVHNKNEKSILIQSTNRPHHYDPNSTQKKLPNTIRDNEIKWKIALPPHYKEDPKNQEKDCIAPWWATVHHGQFVKAYKSSKGKNAKKCKVELRMCLDGVLQWNFRHKTCRYTSDTHDVHYTRHYNYYWSWR